MSAERDEEAGPTLGSDLAIEWRGLRPVPASSRFGQPRELIPFWFALQLFPVALFIGAVAAEGFIGLSLWQGYWRSSSAALWAQRSSPASA